jgi:hypothetical protein
MKRFFFLIRKKMVISPDTNFPSNYLNFNVLNYFLSFSYIFLCISVYCF